MKRVIVTLALVLGLALLAPLAAARVAAGNPNPRVLPVKSKPYGHSYGEWSARWWEWAFSIPVHNPPYTGPIYHPLFDETGAQCGVGQSGHVWFLGGVINETGTATRTCAVPPGTALYFPIANAECSTLEGNGTTEAQLRACAKALIDSSSDLSAEIDGHAVADLPGYRVQSPLFSFTLPADNFLEFFDVAGALPGTYFPSVDDGIYLMLAPLSAGSHTLHLHASVTPTFVLDVTYHLIVGG